MSFGITTDSTELSTERQRSGLPARSSVIGRRRTATFARRPARQFFIVAWYRSLDVRRTRRRAHVASASHCADADGSALRRTRAPKPVCGNSLLTPRRDWPRWRHSAGRRSRAGRCRPHSSFEALRQSIGIEGASPWAAVPLSRFAIRGLPRDMRLPVVGERIPRPGHVQKHLPFFRGAEPVGHRPTFVGGRTIAENNNAFRISGFRRCPRRNSVCTATD
jgi:hypothetical protein